MYRRKTQPPAKARTAASIAPAEDNASAAFSVDDPGSNLLRLGVGQHTLAAARRHAPAIQNPVIALGSITLQPDVHCLALNTHNPRRLRLGQPAMFDQIQRPTPKLFLRRTTDAPKIPSIHQNNIAKLRSYIRYIRGKLVNWGTIPTILARVI